MIFMKELGFEKLRTKFVEKTMFVIKTEGNVTSINENIPSLKCNSITEIAQPLTYR